MENEYKNTKIKAAVRLYCNADPTMAAVRSFEELTVQNDPLFKDLTLLKTCSISRHLAHSVRRAQLRWLDESQVGIHSVVKIFKY